ncbi:Ubiquilin-3 [Gurleya vavrai]
MITINYDNKNFHLDYDSELTISEFRRKVSNLINITTDKMILFYNDVLLNGESEPISFFFPDNSTVFVTKKQDAKKPAFIEQMFGNSNDPEAIYKMFPGLKKSAKDNKQLKELIQNGNLQEEMQKMMSNPSYMKEQMKNADLAMSKLENIPGGMDYINSMMSDVRDPLDNMFKKKPQEFKTGENRNSVINEPISAKNMKPNYLLLYVQQLSELRNYGFKDVSKNVEALIQSDGDLEIALSILTENQTL